MKLLLIVWACSGCSIRKAATTETCLSNTILISYIVIEAIAHLRRSVLVDILIAGTSCKDFSKTSTAQRGYKSSGTLVLGLPASTGGSAETFHGLCSYLEKHAVSIVLFENVDTIDEAPDSAQGTMVTNLEVVVKKLEFAGLTVLTFLIDPALFGLPQQRRRYYLLAVKAAGSAHFSFVQIPLRQVFSTVRSFVSVCQRRHPCASEFILCQTDETVEAELNKRLALGIWGNHGIMGRRV